ncbi:MAG: alpha/beta hydrolase [Cyclobacteriaceae bacterium]
MKSVLLIVVAIYVLLCLIVFFTQEYFLFQRSKLPPDYAYEIEEEYQEVWLGKAQEHHGVHIQRPASKGIIIYFHGNRDSLKRWIRLSKGLLRYDYDLLLIEYPEYGKSKAQLSQKAVEELALLSYDYASEAYAPDSIIIFGRSLGTGLASYLGSQKPAKAIILETPYYSLDDLLSRYLFLMPRRWLLQYSFPSYQWLTKTESLIYILHGTNDQIIPIGMANKLDESLEGKAKMTTIEGGRHHDLSDYQQYWDSLDAIFLN